MCTLWLFEAAVILSLSHSLTLTVFSDTKVFIVLGERLQSENTLLDVSSDLCLTDFVDIFVNALPKVQQRVYTIDSL